MDIIIFFSWQADVPGDYCHYFIRDAIEAAIKRIKKTGAYRDYTIKLEMAAHGVPGTPSIIDTIEERVSDCQIFIGDFTITNTILKKQKSNIFSWLARVFDRLGGNDSTSPLKPQPNANVMYEFGIARSRLGPERVILVMNEAYGEKSLENIPFDAREKRWPIGYHYSKTNEGDRKSILDSLAEDLVGAIRASIEYGIQNPRWPHNPFQDLTRWRSIFQPDVEFERSEIIDGKLKQLLKLASTERTITRVLGLSGLGKTRMVFEAFHNTKNADLQKKVLYLDLASGTSHHMEQLLLLSESAQHFVIILDNCNQSVHIEVGKLVQRSGSRLSLITIDYTRLIVHMGRQL